MIELRCLLHKHGEADPDGTLYVKCGQCSRKQGRSVLHRYTRAQIDAAIARGIPVVWPHLD